MIFKILFLLSNFFNDFAELIEFFVKISPGYDTPANQSPRGIILRGVNLLGVLYPGELLMTPGLDSQFLKCLQRSLRGTVPQKKCGFIF